MRITRNQLRRMIQEEFEVDGTPEGGLGEFESQARPQSIAGGSVEDIAMIAIKAVYDLAAAAGVTLQADVSGPSDVEYEEGPDQTWEE